MNKINVIQNFYLKNNLKIFPIMENKKQPLIDAWQNECSTDFRQVLYWLENAKNCNIALPANENNLFIIDIDMHGVNGLENFERLLKDLGINEIKTLKQTTPSGGIHYIFKSDEDLLNVANSSNCFDDYQGIDVRTKGYILVEPSVINGVPYKLDTTYGINEMPLLLKEFIVNNQKQYEVEHKVYNKPTLVEKGNRDIALFEYLNQLYYKTRLDKEEITLLAYNFGKNNCKPELSDGEIEYKVNKLFKKPRNKYFIIQISEENEGDDEDV